MTPTDVAQTRLLIDAVTAERRVAQICAGRLDRLLIDRGGPARFDVHVGRVRRVLPEIKAAMVALDGVADGLLPFDRSDGPLHEGQWVIVQIARLGFEDKGPKLTGRISLEGLGLIYRPHGGVIDVPRKLKDEARRDQLTALLRRLAAEGESLTLRSVALDWPDTAIEGEFKRLRQIWRDSLAAQKIATGPKQIFQALSDADQLIERHVMQGGACVVDGAAEHIRLRGYLRALGVEDADIAVHRGPSLLFDHEGVEEQIEVALGTRVDLGDGAWLAIDEATALCAIDINGGGADAGDNAGQRALAINCRAATEIVRQVRLRNIGGLVVIDPLRMAARPARDRFEQVLRDAFGDEMTGNVQIGGFTRLGLYEFSRQRSGVSLSARFFAGSAPRPLLSVAARAGILRAIIARMRSQPAGRYQVWVPPGMAAQLQSDPQSLRLLQESMGTVPQIGDRPDLTDMEVIVERIRDQEG
ncbi:ribonuclease E/G [Thalassospira sp.]|uniref:ribonuclease E/G n=1 Tax=Thalassospira sp. TaxID=1912094 RepID=UPI002733BD70|nr:ribonuclease E/G [Thalassospira sp.]MDP2696784.1 ribonuclease E/G [Thalassospira sp.]